MAMDAITHVNATGCEVANPRKSRITHVYTLLAKQLYPGHNIV